MIGWDFVNNDNNPFDDQGHGTHVAGIIGAKRNNQIGIAGVNSSARLMALKSFDANGNGSLSSILPALEYARQMGVKVTNNSWGGNAFSQFLFNEIELADLSGGVFVAAAGNHGLDLGLYPGYPASLSLIHI